MKYTKEEELQKILLFYEKYEGIGALHPKLSQLIENMASVLEAATSAGLRLSHLEIILRQFFRTDDLKFQKLCQTILEKSKLHGVAFENHADMFCHSLENLRTMLKHDPNELLMSIFSQHVEDILQRWQEDKNKHLGNLLYQKSLKDGRALMQGKAWDPKQSDSYKLCKKIQQRKV